MTKFFHIVGRTIISLLIFEALVLAYNNLQNKTAVLGLKLEGQSVSGQKQAEIKKFIDSYIAKKSDRSLAFVYEDKIFKISQSDIGVKAESDNFAKKLLVFGRKGSFWQRFLDQNKAAVGLANYPIRGEVSPGLLAVKLLSISDEVNRDPLPIMPDFVHDLKLTLGAKDGVRVNGNKLSILITDNILDPPREPLALPVSKVFAAYHDEKELVEVRKQAQALTGQALAIGSGGRVFTLTPGDLRSLLVVVERPDPKDPKKAKLNLRLDDKKLNQKLYPFAEDVQRSTHAEFDDHDARVAIYGLFYSGKRKVVDIPSGRSLVLGKKVLGETTGPKVIYLTFDDGPNSIYHPMILDILKQYSVHATFFLVGQNSQRDSDIAKRTNAEGHLIGNHSLTHSFLPNLSAVGINNEIDSTNKILKDISGGEIRLFRPPYGGVNFNVTKAAGDLGDRLTLWDVDPKDWSEPPTDELVRRVVTATVNGSDILLHSNHLATVKALPKIIETLKSQGYSFEILK